MNHEDQIKDYERRLQGISDAIVEKDGEASKLRMEITSLRLTNQRLEAEVEEWKRRYVQYSKAVVGVEKLLREDIEEKFNRIKELEAEVEKMREEIETLNAWKMYGGVE